MAKSAPPPPPDRPSRAQIEELRAKASADLERAANQPLSEKAKLDAALLDSAKSTKH